MRRTAVTADVQDVSFETLRARVQATDTDALRLRVAPVVELLPIIPFVAQFSFTDSDTLTPLWPLAMVAGLGWILAHHWRMGLGFAFVRLVVLYVGLMALIYTSLADTCAEGDPRCIDTGATLADAATPLLWALCALYLAMTIGSAFLLNRSCTHTRTALRNQTSELAN
jgi:hypothetical protein